MVRSSYDMVLIFPPIRTWDNPRNFPTGLGLVAARLRKAGHRVAVIDANGLRLSDEEVLEWIKEYDAPVIGIGGLITTYGWVKRMARKIRQARPGCRIVLGGSVGTSIVETALDRLDIDVIAVGEADDTVLELLPALLNGEGLEGIAGLAYKRDGMVVRTAERTLIEDVNELPYPAWDLFPMQVYLENPVVGVGKDVDIISSRGCSFNCQYCYKIFGRKFRGRSAEHVVGEMEALKRLYDVDFISFQDDCFVIDKGRVYEICDRIDRSKRLKGIRWSCNGRVTVCDLAMLRRMRASGCVSVAYGVESGSEKILKAMNKCAPLEQVRKTIEISRQAGMRTPLAFMIGYPGETRETVMETVAFCQEMNIPLTSMMITCPYPGTPLYKQLREAGVLKGDEEKLVLKMGDAVDLTVNLTEMSDGQLLSLRQEALDLARQNYAGPTPAEEEAFEKALYGEELYRKKQQQLRDPRMRAHLQRHGFNEGQRGEKAGAETKKAEGLPGWVDGRVRPYIIAEAGVNHNGQLATALELVEAAKEAGADCVKFQAFNAEELVLKDAPKAEYQEACGEAGESQYEMLRRYEMGRNAFGVIQERCASLGIDFLVTPFSTRWVRALVDMGVSAIKIGSGNIDSGSLLDVIGQTGLPVVVSTGMCDLEEVNRTLRRLRSAGCGPVSVMHCVSLYPTKLSQANLQAIQTLKGHLGVPIGFSDHTVETITGALAVTSGAVLLEKHFTLDRSLDGPDHKASLEPAEMAEYVRLARAASAACGSGCKEPHPEELPVKDLVRLSLVSAKFIKAGSVITEDMLTTKRPGTGISAEQMQRVVGSKVICDIEADQLLRLEHIEIRNRK